MGSITESKPKIVAFVPMRHESERVPRKNYRDLAGRPLYTYILETLQACPEIAEIVVDTDSPVIMDGLRQDFPAIQILERPEALRGGEVDINRVLLHDVSVVEADFYLQTHSTNPLLRSDTVSMAVRSFLEVYPEKDSLFSVTRYQTRLWDAEGRAINHDPDHLIRTQDLPPLYEENSCLYIFERETFLRRQNRIGERPMLYPISRFEALDIDEEFDFEMARCMMQHRGRDWK